MDQVESQDGSKILLERAGNGPPIMLVSGALSDRAGSTSLADELSRSMTVIRYDRRGRGTRSATPPGTVGEEIDDLRAIADLVGHDMALYGHSSGGIVALEAVLAGFPCRGLVLYEPPYIADTQDRDRPPTDFAVRLRRLLDGPGGGDAALREFLRLGPDISPDAIQHLAESESWGRLLRLANTLPSEATIVGQGDIPYSRLAQLQLPTLILQGGASPVWVRNAMSALADALPSARLVVLDGLDHGGARLDPRRVAAAVVSFVTGIASR
jgi:pimeloyl-ACP methyl ester carboxylesterase